MARAQDDTAHGPGEATRPPRAGEELDLDALSRWFAELGLEPGGPLEVTQFPAGHSNLTYRVRGAGCSWVVRRPPVGAQVKSGHDMAREYRMLSALWGRFPVPRPLGLDEGRHFAVPHFVMEEVTGRVLRKRPPPEVTTAGWARLSGLTVDTLAALHTVDPDAVHLSSLHRGEGYARRQVEGWARRWELAQTGPEQAEVVARLMRHLLEHIPADAGAVVVHNDLKYDNLVFDESLERVVAVLDWEMATVGCPWMDLGTSLGYWVEAGDPPVMKMLAMGPTWVEGNLDRAGVVARYEAATGRRVESAVFYFAFGLFKIAVVAQQIFKRFVEGRTADPRFASLDKAVVALAELALLALERDRLGGFGAAAGSRSAAS